jgi:hypothetical protein
VKTATVFILSAASAEDKHSQGQSQAQRSPVGLLRPVSFNAAFGDGTCSRDTGTGAITLDGFLGELTSDQSVGAWRFSPAQVESKHLPITLALQNTGCETPTFTRVQKFRGGRGCAEPGFRQSDAGSRMCPASERRPDSAAAQCRQSILPAGGTASASVPRKDNEIGYQCCIHPWMRLVVNHQDDRDHNH